MGKNNNKLMKNNKHVKFRVKRLVFLIFIGIILGSLFFRYGIENTDNKSVLASENQGGSGNGSVGDKFIRRGLDKELEALNIVEPKYEWGPDMKAGNNPKMLIIHHSASTGQSVEDIHEEHKEKGWDGIGYNFYIRKDGTIYRGRPENTVGAHTLGKNKESLGICLEGDFEKDILQDDQKDSLIRLLRYLSKKYGIQDIVGHRDEYDTLCPGSNISISEIKKSVLKK